MLTFVHFALPIPRHLQLIESIDNANMITSMKMWPPLLSLLASPSERIQLATLWIIGTALQNNPAAQDAFLQTHTEGQANSLDTVLGLLNHSAHMGVRAKAMYALSALLGHHPRAVRDFEAKGGYDALKGALRDPSINIRRKAAFLINALLLQDDSASQAAAAQPLLLGAPPAASSSSSAPTVSSSAPASRATGVALAPSSAQPSAPAGSGPAPLEKPPVTSTASSGIVHPCVSSGLVRSGLLKLLLSSLLPAGSHASAEGDDAAPPPELGPDGDSQEARHDEDYAEKALRAASTFVSRYNEADVARRAPLDDGARQALKAVREEMEEDGKGDAKTWDWRRLGLDEEEWNKFTAGLQRLA